MSPTQKLKTNPLENYQLLLVTRKKVLPIKRLKFCYVYFSCYLFLNARRAHAFDGIKFNGVNIDWSRIILRIGSQSESVSLSWLIS